VRENRDCPIKGGLLIHCTVMTQGVDAAETLFSSPCDDVKKRPTSKLWWVGACFVAPWDVG
jgi:hypothetical protein